LVFMAGKKQNEKQSNIGFVFGEGSDC